MYPTAGCPDASSLPPTMASPVDSTLSSSSAGAQPVAAADTANDVTTTMVTRTSCANRTRSASFAIEETAEEAGELDGRIGAQAASLGPGRRAEDGHGRTIAADLPTRACTR